MTTDSIIDNRQFIQASISGIISAEPKFMTEYLRLPETSIMTKKRNRFYLRLIQIIRTNKVKS